MSKSKSNNKVRKIIKSSLGQGIIAFIVGALGYAAGQASMSLFAYGLDQAFYANGGYHALAILSGPWLWVPIVTMVTVTTAISAALGASAVVLAMRAAGVPSKWRAAVTMIVLSCIFYVLISLVMLSFHDYSWHGVFVQTLEDFASIMALGLPFSIAWLVANRKK